MAKKAIDDVRLPIDGVLMWDRPRQRVSKKAWKDEYGFDGGPDGGYQPNMSEDDANRWKAKLVGTRTGFPQVEIRKQAGPSLMLIIVNLGAGYSYKSRTPSYDVEKAEERWSSRDIAPMSLVDRIGLQDVSAGTQVHVSMNGPAMMDFEDLANMHKAVEEAKAVLASLETAPGERSLQHIDLAEDVDLAQTIERLAEIPGVRVHLVLESERFVVVSTVDAAMDALRGTRGVVRIRDRETIAKDAGRALNRAYGLDDDEDDE